MRLVYPAGNISVNSTPITGGTDKCILFDKSGKVSEDTGFTFDYTNRSVGLGAAASSPDAILFRDAAGILAQRNGSNAQSLRVYNTFTSSSVYERGVFDWRDNSNILTIGAENTGLGTTLRNVNFVGSQFGFETTTVNGFVDVTDVFSNMGARSVMNVVGNSTDTHVPSFNFGVVTFINTTTSVTPTCASFLFDDTVVAANQYTAAGVFCYFTAHSSGTPATVRGELAFGVRDGANVTEQMRCRGGHIVSFGGTSNAFPALKSSGGVFLVRFADDSAFTDLEAASLYAAADSGAGGVGVNALTNGSSTTISTGVGSVKMSSVNNANNTGWLKCYIGNQAAWIPTWTTNAP